MKAKLFVIALALAAIVLASGCVQPPGNGNGQNPEEHFCAPESRNGDACTLQYEPVCGWFDGSKIQCIAYPCAGNYSNSCMACLDEKVLYWTEGNCPA